MIRITCQVASDPDEDMKFEWVFSKEDETPLDIQQSKIR